MKRRIFTLGKKILIALGILLIAAVVIILLVEKGDMPKNELPTVNHQQEIMAMKPSFQQFAG